jgi:glutamine amidotransferase
MGWNELSLLRSSPLFNQMSRTPVFYFVHSYHLLPTARSVISATCEYGGDMAAAIEMDNIFGVQFHPEKSQHDGLRLLKNFASF